MPVRSAKKAAVIEAEQEVLYEPLIFSKTFSKTIPKVGSGMARAPEVEEEEQEEESPGVGPYDRLPV
jgi:hypothetical protein